MIMKQLVLGGCTAVLLSVATAHAGPCNTDGKSAHGPRAARVFFWSDRIACIHMSGLLMRLVTAGQDGFPRREFQTSQRPLQANGSHGVSRTLDRSILPSAPLAAPAPVEMASPKARSPTDLCYAACADAIDLAPA
jgi:hypothetical protein